MDDTAESITHRWVTLRNRAGLKMAQLARELGYKGPSSIQRYENPEAYSGGYLPPDLVKKLMKALVGKGEPPIEAEEVAELAGPDFVAVYKLRGKILLSDDEIDKIAREYGSPSQRDDPSFGSITGLRGVPEGTIAEIDLAAGLGAGGITMLTEASDKHGHRFAADSVRDYWRLPEWILGSLNVRSNNVAAFQSKGDSMEPTLRSGDVVFIDLNHKILSPDGLYAILDEFGGVVVKRLEIAGRDGDGEVLIDIIADNPRHSRKQEKASELQIIGRVAGRFSVM
ncbi:LexA family transcriptional regulator [Rhizobium rhizogenes]|uniref:LexA family transcriptional regulator n=1 Tax=Rhizobium rhizogenes TaxID=359 RepID=UPI001571A26E|nr:S24 family peptidase [Rhizobium rhizogenes]NTG07115.1 hypothetical protein [Rhizobium rhizogenes]